MAWEPGALIALETERLILRSMVREDATEQFVQWLADPEVMLGLNLHRRRLSRAQAAQFVLKHDNHVSFCLAIELKGDGTVGFFTVNRNLANRTAETAVVIGEREHWGKNLVLEGRAALLDFLFDELACHKVIGRPHSRNISSIFNYKAMGFTCEGVLREEMQALDSDKRLDQLVFGILATEWRDQKARLEGAAS